MTPAPSVLIWPSSFAQEKLTAAFTTEAAVLLTADAAELTTDWATDWIEEIAGRIVEVLTGDDGGLTSRAATFRAPPAPDWKFGEFFFSKHCPPPELFGFQVKPKQVGVVSQSEKHDVKSPLSMFVVTNAAVVVSEEQRRL